MTEALTSVEEGILRTIDAHGGALTPTLIEFLARDDVRPAAEERGEDSHEFLDALLDDLHRRELLQARRLLDQREVLLLTESAAALAGIAEPNPVTQDEGALWIQVYTLLARLTAESLGLGWFDSLSDASEATADWQVQAHFEGNPARYCDPEPPVRTGEMGDKKWSFVQREHERACRIQSIYRRSVEDAARAWVAQAAGEIAAVVQPPPPFVVYEGGRTRALLFRTRLDPAKSWDRQMGALSRIHKLLVVPHAELIQPYVDQTEPDYPAASFEGPAAPYATWLEVIESPKFLHAL